MKAQRARMDLNVMLLRGTAVDLLDEDLRVPPQITCSHLNEFLELRVMTQVLRLLKTPRETLMERAAAGKITTLDFKLLVDVMQLLKPDAPQQGDEADAEGGGGKPQGEDGEPPCGQALAPTQLGQGGAEQGPGLVSGDDLVKVVDGHGAATQGPGVGGHDRDAMLLTPSCKLALAMARKRAKATGCEVVCIEHLLAACVTVMAQPEGDRDAALAA